MAALGNGLPEALSGFDALRRDEPAERREFVVEVLLPPAAQTGCSVRIPT